MNTIFIKEEKKEEICDTSKQNPWIVWNFSSTMSHSVLNLHFTGQTDILCQESNNDSQVQWFWHKIINTISYFCVCYIPARIWSIWGWGWGILFSGCPWLRNSFPLSILFSPVPHMHIVPLVCIMDYVTPYISMLKQTLSWALHLSPVARKPVFGLCNQGRLKLACSANETS